MNDKRRTFNHLHTELSLHHDAFYNRYKLWLSLSISGFNPDDLKPEEAAVWCEEHKYRKLSAQMRQYNPETVTPEEFMSRLCEA